MLPDGMFWLVAAPALVCLAWLLKAHLDCRAAVEAMRMTQLEGSWERRRQGLREQLLAGKRQDVSADDSSLAA